MKNIVLIRFSSRDNGNCAAITAQIQQYYKEEMVRSFIADHLVVKPCGNCDYECLQPQRQCPNITVVCTELFYAVCNADLVYYVVPNYCGYPCANYFAFNEQSVGFFNLDRCLMEKYMSVPKRFIIVSNSEGEIFEKAMQQQTNDNPEILYLKSNEYGKRSIVGDILESDAAKADLTAFLAQHSF